MAFNVLVVDDEEFLREMFKETLEGWGHNVLLANDGVEGVLAVLHDAGRQIDFVLMDVTMPNLDGLNALRIMRSVNPSLAIIIFTGYSSNDNYCRQALNFGALHCFNKPFKMNEVMERMADYCAQSSTSRDSSTSRI